MDDAIFEVKTAKTPNLPHVLRIQCKSVLRRKDPDKAPVAGFQGGINEGMLVKSDLESPRTPNVKWPFHCLESHSFVYMGGGYVWVCGCVLM